MYILFALTMSFITLGIILWSLNLELLWYIVAQSPLNPFQKLEFVFDIYGGIASNYQSLQAMVMVLFAGLFGINAAILLYVVRGGQKQALKSGSSVGGLTAAVIGGGCIACGTSIITPVIASFGATATIGLNNTIGLIVNLIGIVFICYSLIGLGQRAATISAS